jgi:hypothetical protein
MKLGAKLKTVKSTFSMKITGRKVLKLMIKIKIQNHILNLHKLKMKTRMIIRKKYTIKLKPVQYQRMIEMRQIKFNLSRSSIQELGLPT